MVKTLPPPLGARGGGRLLLALAAFDEGGFGEDVHGEKVESLKLKV